MLNAARLSKELREGEWAEAAKMAMDLNNLVVTPNQPVAPLHRFYEITNPKLKVAKPFGEMDIVENNQRCKICFLEDRGRPCMFLGRAPNHADYTYRFLNLATKQSVVTFYGSESAMVIGKVLRRIPLLSFLLMMTVMMMMTLLSLQEGQRGQRWQTGEW
jgi:hypothetical protein